MSNTIVTKLNTVAFLHSYKTANLIKTIKIAIKIFPAFAGLLMLQ